ncbi:hypothetical protein RND71_006083 [Anisodus tanguticus]|uniref:F-box domain-containing protein n=1 Tax=Anisodus tanguticus TaxID=243964 RepID=A0AAE1STC9_9SOLA|nr:hypothetical protein RND71_006083 [Anisodus tanguticus]
MEQINVEKEENTIAPTSALGEVSQLFRTLISPAELRRLWSFQEGGDAMGGTDQISKLPEPILEHILSFLVVKDAAKTSILSKAWNNAWTSLSCLDFGDNFFEKSQHIIVDQILATGLKQNIFIRRFMLLPDSWSKYVDNWIKILVACNIEELFLDVDTDEMFPEAIFAAKALKVLSLRGFKLELPSDDGIKVFICDSYTLRTHFWTISVFKLCVQAALI